MIWAFPVKSLLYREMAFFYGYQNATLKQRLGSESGGVYGSDSGGS